MSSSYPIPIFFVTVQDQPASCEVMKLLPEILRRHKHDNSETSCFRTVGDGDELITAYNITIALDRTVVLFDANLGARDRFKPLHRVQIDKDRPAWANAPLWSIKINTGQRSNEVVIQQCAQQAAAWFRKGIKHATPGKDYPWGPIPGTDRNARLLKIASQVQNGISVDTGVI